MKILNIGTCYELFGLICQKEKKNINVPLSYIFHVLNPFGFGVWQYALMHYFLWNQNLVAQFKSLVVFSLETELFIFKFLISYYNYRIIIKKNVVFYL